MAGSRGGAHGCHAVAYQSKGTIEDSAIPASGVPHLQSCNQSKRNCVFMGPLISIINQWKPCVMTVARLSTDSVMAVDVTGDQIS